MTKVVLLIGKENEAIKERLTKYLMRDETGIRKSVLKIFLNEQPYTTQNVFDRLKEQGFAVNYRGVSAMVGLMNTRLGILRIDVKGDHNVYSLKYEYKNSVKATMDNY
jgi:arginine repressor